MKMKILHLITGILSLVVIGVLLLSLTSFGLTLGVNLVNFFIPGEIQTVHVQGRLIDQFKAHKLSYRDENLYLAFEDLELDWNLLQLLRGEVIIQKLSAQKLLIETSDTEESKAQVFNLDKLKAQYPLVIDHFQVRELKLQSPDLVLYHLEGTLAFNEEGLRLREVELTHQYFDMKLQGNLGPGFEPPIKLIAQEDFTLDGTIQIQGETRLEGDLHKLEGAQHFSDPLKASLTLTATDLGPEFKIQAEGETQISELDLIDEDLYGSLHFKLGLDYNHATGQGLAKIQSDDSEINSETLKLNFEGQIKDHEVHWKNSVFMLGNNSLKSSGRYGTDHTEIQYDFQLEVYRALISGRGQLLSPDNQQWMTSLKALELTFPDKTQYALNQATQLHWQKDGIMIYPDLCLSSPEKGSICAQNPTESEVHLLFKDIPNQLLASYFTNRVLVSGKWQAQADLYMEGLNFDHLDMSLQIPPADFMRNNKKRHVIFETGKGEIQLSINQKELKSKALFHLIDDDQISWDLEVLNWEEIDIAQLNAQIKGSVTHWDPLRLFITDTNDFAGSLNIHLKVNGTVAEPIYGGSMVLSQARLAIPSQGIILQEGQLSLSPSEASQALALNGSIKSNEGLLKVEGTLSLKDTWPSLDLDLTGDRFMVSNTRRAVVYISPLLHLQTQERLIDLTGELVIPEATLNVKGYESYISPSPDIIIIQEDLEIVEPIFEINSKVLLSLGDKVKLNAGNLQTGVGGQLQLVKYGNWPLRATGQLYAVDGKYSAYGKKLDLSQAVLTFNNSLLDNPSLFIEASRKVQVTQTQNAAYLFSDPSTSSKNLLVDGTVGLRITGTVQNPKYNFYSNPPMSEADQLSYLLTGTPASQIGSAQAAFMFAALTESSGVLGVSDIDAARLQNIVRSIGIDFNIESSTRIDQNTGQAVPGTNVVVGKALFPKFYVSYTVGLLDPLNVFRVRYQLGNHWAVQSQANTQGDTGGDILYGVETDKFLGMD